MNILVTGGAGFIGSALALRLKSDGHTVVVLDNFNDYYDVTLKRARQKYLLDDIEVIEGDITNREVLQGVFRARSFDVVCHLAAQAGVRYSVEAPEVYVTTNILGTQILYEVMKEHGVSRMVYASTSSVYGTTTPRPFKEDALADRPVSVYAATKRAAELVAHNYFIQYGIQTTCLRFFTVYGPWSRPDMAMFKFAQQMTAGLPIEIFNNGNLSRDFTFIDDIVDGFVRAVSTPLGYEILNLGNGSPIKLLSFVESLEKELGIVAVKKMLPMQQGDVYETFADTTKALELIDFKAKTSFDDGMRAFAQWYKNYYKV